MIEEFENSIPEKAIRLSVKIDYADQSSGDFTSDFWESDRLVDSVKAFVVDHFNIIACGAGLHLKGRLEKPHVHYVFICGPGKIPSNMSVAKDRWLKKDENKEYTLGKNRQVTFKFDELDPEEYKWQVLSYVLKEGLEIPGTWKWYRPKMNPEMPKVVFETIKELGQIIYERQVALLNRQDRCEERKKNVLQDIYRIAEEGHKRLEFSNVRQLAEFLELNYIQKLDLTHKPSRRNYQEYVYQVANTLGFYSYSSMF